MPIAPVLIAPVPIVQLGRRHNPEIRVRTLSVHQDIPSRFSVPSQHSRHNMRLPCLIIPQLPAESFRDDEFPWVCLAQPYLAYGIGGYVLCFLYSSRGYLVQ